MSLTRTVFRQLAILGRPVAACGTAQIAKRKQINCSLITCVRGLKMEGQDNEQAYTTSAADQAHVAELKRHMATNNSHTVTGSGALTDVKDVVIDSGVYKYVLIMVHDPATGEEKAIVRGTYGAAYHADVADPWVRDLQKKGFSVDVTGGGRIKKDDRAKSISIYGYSYGFGRAEHSVAADLCATTYPDYKVDWSDEGY